MIKHRTTLRGLTLFDIFICTF